MFCVTQGFAERIYLYWEENGFARRFLILQYQFLDTDVLVDAIGENRPFQLSADAMIRWPSDRIPMMVTETQFQYLKQTIQDQFGVLIPLQFSKRILNTLQWHYRERYPNDLEQADAYAENVFMAVAPLMRKCGGALIAKRASLQLMNSSTVKEGKPSGRKRA